MNVEREYIEFEKNVLELNNYINRKSAEEKLQQIRNGDLALEITRLALQKSDNPLVLFHALSNLRLSKIVAKLSRDQLDMNLDMLQAFVEHLQSNTETPHFVRTGAYSSVAFLVKLQWLEMSNEERGALLQRRYLQFGAKGYNETELAMFSALMDEFSGVDRSSLKPLFFHKECQEQFETFFLLNLLQMFLQKLGQASSNENVELIKRLIANIEKILNWGFVTLPQVDVTVSSGSGYYPESWYLVLEAPETAQLFSSLIQKLLVLSYTNPGLDSAFDKLLQCLVCLCSMKFNSEKRGHALIHVVSELMQLALRESAQVSKVAHSTGLQRLILLLGQMSNSLLSNCKILDEESSILHGFLTSALQLCLTSIAQAVQTNRIAEVDETWAMESLVEYLSFWASVSRQQMPESMQSKVHSACFMVFRDYTLARLRFAQRAAELDDEEFDDEMPRDAEVYAEQLEHVALLGRRSLPDASGFALDQIQQLFTTLRQCTNDPAAFVAACESLHWLLLVVGHLLGDRVADNEYGLIPEFVLGYKNDDLAGLVGILATALALLDYMATASPDQASPLLCETIYWFCARVFPAYLVPDVASYGYMPSILLQAFSNMSAGEPVEVLKHVPYGDYVSGGGRAILAKLIDCSMKVSLRFSGEPQVITEVMGLFSNLAKNSTTALELRHCATLVSLLQMLVSHLDKWPEKVHETIMCTVTTVCGAAFEGAQMEQMLEQVFGAVIGRLSACERSTEATLSTLDMCVGISLACVPKTAPKIFAFQIHLFETLLSSPMTDTRVYSLVLRLCSCGADKQCFAKLDLRSRALFTALISQLVARYVDSNMWQVLSFEEGVEVSSYVANAALRLIEQCADSDTPIAVPFAENLRAVGADILLLAEKLVPLVKEEFFQQNAGFGLILVKLTRALFEHLTPFLPQFKHASFLANVLLQFGLVHDSFDVMFEAFDSCSRLALAIAKEPSLLASFGPLIECMLTVIFKQLIYANVDLELINRACDVVFELAVFQPNFFQSESFLHDVLQNKASQTANELGALTHVFHDAYLAVKNASAPSGPRMPKPFVSKWYAALTKFVTRARNVLL